MLLETRRQLSTILKVIAPKIYWSRKLNYLKNNFTEIEMNLLPVLCDKHKTSIDIGAAGGVFIANLESTSKNVIGFEPIPNDAKRLNEMIGATHLKAHVINEALSNKNGQAILKMIKNDLGRSTIESANLLEDETGSEKLSINVAVSKLDDYHYKNIGFIKIDVEGHELSVLEGAYYTIKNNLPNLLIEIEERHKSNALKSVLHFMKQFDYSCYFIHENQLKPIEVFELSKFQDCKNIGNHLNGYERKGVYINNFIFVPKFKSDDFLNASQLLLSKLLT
jgi:FkbM family methyltransferase